MSGTLALVYVAIGVASLALLLLIVGVLVWRDEVFGPVSEPSTSSRSEAPELIAQQELAGAPGGWAGRPPVPAFAGGSPRESERDARESGRNARGPHEAAARDAAVREAPGRDRGRHDEPARERPRREEAAGEREAAGRRRGAEDARDARRERSQRIEDPLRDGGQQRTEDPL